MASVLSDNFQWEGRPVTLGIPPMGKQGYISAFSAAPFKYFNASPGYPLASHAGLTFIPIQISTPTADDIIESTDRIQCHVRCFYPANQFFSSMIDRPRRTGKPSMASLIRTSTSSDSRLSKTRSSLSSSFKTHRLSRRFWRTRQSRRRQSSVVKSF